MDIADLRQEYRRATLDAADVDADPLRQFERWLGEALRADLPEPTAMTLATVNEAGRPSARIVLLKDVNAGGFSFFTNYGSRKGRELEIQAQAALLFYWAELERQVRIEGIVEKLPAAESDSYYRSRPPGSRIGAWASPQSESIADRTALEKRFAEAKARHGDDPPRPPHWGGYRLKPAVLEFWQGRPSRLHDRIRYRLQDGRWKIDRLAP